MSDYKNLYKSYEDSLEGLIYGDPDLFSYTSVAPLDEEEYLFKLESIRDISQSYLDRLEGKPASTLETRTKEALQELVESGYPKEDLLAYINSLGV